MERIFNTNVEVEEQPPALEQQVAQVDTVNTNVEVEEQPLELGQQVVQVDPETEATEGIVWMEEQAAL